MKDNRAKEGGQRIEISEHHFLSLVTQYQIRELEAITLIHCGKMSNYRMTIEKRDI